MFHRARTKGHNVRAPWEHVTWEDNPVRRRSLGVLETLSLLDEGALPAIAIDPGQRVVRAVNGALTDELALDPGEIEDEVVHAIVDQQDHGLVDAILDALAHGANLGPTRVALRLPHMREPRMSVWSRIPGVHEAIGSTLVLLCRPLGYLPARGAALVDPDPASGYGRIPPFRWRRRR